MEFNWAQCEICHKWRGLGYGNPWKQPHFICTLIHRTCLEPEDTLEPGETEDLNYELMNQNATNNNKTKKRGRPFGSTNKKKKVVIMDETSDSSEASSDSELSGSESESGSGSSNSESGSDSSGTYSSSGSSSSDDEDSIIISGDEDMGPIMIQSSRSRNGNRGKRKRKHKKKVSRRPQLGIRCFPEQKLPKGWTQDRHPDNREKANGGYRCVFYSPGGKSFMTLVEAQTYAGKGQRRKEQLLNERAKKAAKMNAKKSKSKGKKRPRSNEPPLPKSSKKTGNANGKLAQGDMQPHNDSKRRRTSTHTKVLICKNANGSAFEEGNLLSSDGDRKRYAIQLQHSKVTQLVPEYRVIFMVEGSHQRGSATRGRQDVGRTLLVYWQGDLTWYGAKVVDYRPKSKSRFTHFVRYHDGDTGWLDMSQERYIWVNPDSQLKEHERYVFFILLGLFFVQYILC